MPLMLSLNVERQLSCLKKGNVQNRETVLKVQIGRCCIDIDPQRGFKYRTLKYEVIIIQEDDIVDHQLNKEAMICHQTLTNG